MFKKVKVKKKTGAAEIKPYEGQEKKRKPKSCD